MEIDEVKEKGQALTRGTYKPGPGDHRAAGNSAWLDVMWRGKGAGGAAGDSEPGPSVEGQVQSPSII